MKVTYYCLSSYLNTCLWLTICTIDLRYIIYYVRKHFDLPLCVLWTIDNKFFIALGARNPLGVAIIVSILFKGLFDLIRFITAT